MNNDVIAGVDEAGRGALAGPLVVASVIFYGNAFCLADRFKDSKSLSENRRIALYKELVSSEAIVSVHSVSHRLVDRLNVLNATMLAMKRSVMSLSFLPDKILVDGNRLPEWTYRSEAIVRGDTLIPEIAAASIVAKVIRDRFMRCLSEKFPCYFFSKHKGYGTQLHYQCLKKFGVSPVHRLTFNLKL